MVSPRSLSNVDGYQILPLSNTWGISVRSESRVRDVTSPSTSIGMQCDANPLFLIDCFFDG